MKQYESFADLPPALQHIPKPEIKRRKNGVTLRYKKKVTLPGLPSERLSISVRKQERDKDFILAEEEYKMKLVSQINSLVRTGSKEKFSNARLKATIDDFLYTKKLLADNHRMEYVTYTAYVYNLKCFLEFAGDVSMSELHPTVINKYLDYMSIKKDGTPRVKAGTVQNYYSKLKHFFIYCEEDLKIYSEHENPFKGIKAFQSKRVILKQTNTKATKSLKQRNIDRLLNREEDKNKDEFYSKEQMDILLEVARCTNLGIFYSSLTDKDKVAEYMENIEESYLPEMSKKTEWLAILNSLCFQYTIGARHGEVAALDSLSVDIHPGQLEKYGDFTVILFDELNKWNNTLTTLVNTLIYNYPSNPVINSVALKPKGSPLVLPHITFRNMFSVQFTNMEELKDYLLKYKREKLWKEVEALPQTYDDLVDRVLARLNTGEHIEKEEHSLLRVDKTIRTAEDHTLYIGMGTKTEGEGSNLPLSIEATYMLYLALITKFGKWVKYNNYSTVFFSSARGTNPATGGLFRGKIKEVIAKINEFTGEDLPILPSHAFRRSFVMRYMTEKPDSLNLVSAYVRHKNVKTTLRFYTRNTHSGYTEKMGNLFDLIEGSED